MKVASNNFATHILVCLQNNVLNVETGTWNADKRGKKKPIKKTGEEDGGNENVCKIMF